MTNDEHDDVSGIRELYRSAAHERASAALDAAVLQTAHEHGRRARWVAHGPGLALAAVAVLALVAAQAWQRSRTQAAAIRAHYAEVTRPYLLDADLGEGAFGPETRWMLGGHEDPRSAHQKPETLPAYRRD